VTEDDCLVVMACDGVWDVLSDQEAIGQKFSEFLKSPEIPKSSNSSSHGVHTCILTTCVCARACACACACACVYETAREKERERERERESNNYIRPRR
jgi:hypothetical protein